MLVEGINSGREYIGKVFVNQGLINQEQLESCLAIAKKSGKKIGSVLKEKGLVNDVGIANALAEQLQIPVIDLSQIEVTEDVLRTVPENLAEDYLVFPVKVEHGVLTLAMQNPLDTVAMNDVRFVSKLPIEIAVAPENQIVEALNTHYFSRQDLSESFLSNAQNQNEFEVVSQDSELESEGEVTDELLDLSDKPPIIKFTNSILIDAMRQKASDIHIEPRQNSVLIRYRIDGVIKSVMETKRRIYSSVLIRIKILCGLDISIRRKPQDGKFKVQFAGAPIDLRVSTLPTAYGEKITIRILNSSAGPESIESLGLREPLLAKLKSAISQPQGLVLVTGPTGSGKSTTLHACIKSLHSPEVNIVTLENPIEYELEGINQVEVNPKQGLTFAGGLRSILRQDPDIILLGEIRDEETAEVAFDAGQTGHLVLSTLHTNSALATLGRLQDLEIDLDTLAAGVNAIVSQRLVRKLCEHCKQISAGDQNNQRYWEAVGCAKCDFTGYSGRIGVHEVLLLTPNLKHLIAEGTPLRVIEQAAIKEGLETLHEDGLAKARMGLTCLSEVYRVAPPLHEEIEQDDQKTESSKKAEKDDDIMNLDGQVDLSELPVHAIRPPKILVVTLQEMLQYFLRGILEGDGNQVITASNGNEAIQKTQSEIPDLIICELGLAAPSTIELVETIRSKLATSYIPIVVIGESETDSAAAFNAGANDFLTKPINAASFNSHVSRLLGQQDSS